MTDVIRLFGPLVLWLASFSAVYGLHAVLCRQGWDQMFLAAAWALAIALQGAVLWMLMSKRFGASSAFVRRTSVALGGVALIAVIWTLSPVAFLARCGVP